ncbi:MAG: phenylalanine--tRNA ligase subunit beta, partial [Chitinophagaceae bacterium]
ASQPLCIAGVFGGKDSGVSVSTTNIFLESAYFDSVSVRKTSKKHGLKTDASFRFERGTDPEMTVVALKRAALLIQEIAGGTISSEIGDIYPSPVTPARFEVTFQEINDLIGASIEQKQVISILNGLGIETSEVSDQGFTATVPAFKVDVTRPCDITEEVLRIYGYNNIAIPSKINASLGNTQRPDREQTQHFVADMLSGQGFSEIWCNSLTRSAYAIDKASVVEILNPLSSDLSIMRQSLVHPALESVAYNQNRKMPDIKFYEFGKTYAMEGDAYTETQKLLLMLSGSAQAEGWSTKQTPVTFYHIKAAVEGILARLGITAFQSEELTDELASYGVRYFRGSSEIVRFGAVAEQTRKLVGVDKEVFFAEFNWSTLLEITAKLKIKNKEVAKFPSVRRDLSMLVDKNVSFDTLRAIAFKTERKLVKEVNIFDVFLGGKSGSLPDGKKSYALNFILQDDQQTLTDKQIDAVMQKIMHNLAKEVNAEIRK